MATSMQKYIYPVLGFAGPHAHALIAKVVVHACPVLGLAIGHIIWQIGQGCRYAWLIDQAMHQQGNQSVFHGGRHGALLPPLTFLN